MTTVLLWRAIPLLVLAAGVAGWLLHRRRRRAGMDASTAGQRAAVMPRPMERMDDVPAGSTDDEFLTRMYATAFANGPDEGARLDPTDAAHQQVLAAAGTVLSRLEPDSRYTPRRPNLLPQLLKAVNDEDSSGRDIAAIIARDPALAGNLLRMANSALYRVRPAPVENIQRAVAMIGTDGLRQMIAVALMQPVLGDGPGAFGRLPSLIWEHTLLSAVATAEYARRVERLDTFTAQMLGLLHGLGAIVVVQVARDHYARQPALAPDPDALIQLLEQWTAPTARRLAQDWSLSPRIAPALDYQRRDAPLAELSPLGRSLRIGRAVGAVAMLHRAGEIDGEAAFAQLQGWGLREDFATRIWERLAGSPREQ